MLFKFIQTLYIEILITWLQNLGHCVNELSLMQLGKVKQTTLIAVFLFLAYSATGQTGKNYKFRLNANLPENEIIPGQNSVIVNYSVPELNVESLVNNNGTFYRLSIPGHISSADVGKPEVPVFSRLISIPAGSGFTIKITGIKSTRITPSSKKIQGILYPVQEGEIKSDQQINPEFNIDKKTYSGKELIPSDTVRIERLGTARSNKLANLYIYPVRYNPRSNYLEVITSMTIEITCLNPVTVSNARPGERALFNESLDKGVLNFNPGQVIPGYSDKPVKMVILTDTAFRKLLQPFFKWKTQKGFKLNILYKGEKLAGNDYIQLKDTLSKIYKSSSVNDPPPEYLLIIGDVNRIPYYGSGGTGNITDMYYGEFDGNGDYIPEMFVGRLPVADTNELKTVVRKIIQYEKFQFADGNNFYNRALASAGYDDNYASYMNGQLKYACSNYLSPANNVTGYHFNYPQSYTSKDSLIKLINSGLSFINYTGHGEALGWLHINFKFPDLQLLNNKNMYPFVISNACRTAQFTLGNSLGAGMVLSQDKGAIGFIGCSNDSYWDEDYYWAVGPGTISADPTYEGTGLGAYDRLFHTHGEPPSAWYFSMGQINYAGNLAVSASTSSRKKYYWETYNLIGDPSVIPIIGTPGNFNVSLPDTLPNGIKSFTLNIDPFAYVAISHFDTLWDASYASNSGTVTLDLPGRSNDSCLVVITGQNKKPIIRTIYFSNITKEFINLTGSSINDTLGNNNNIADYGESFAFKLTLSNLGLTKATGVTAKISTSSEWLTITSDSVALGNLNARSDTIIHNIFRLKVSENVPDLAIATVNLILKDQHTEKHYSIDVLLHAPELEILNCILDDSSPGNGDNIPDQGETIRLIFKIQNRGSSEIEGQFNVSCFEKDISFIDNDIKSGVLKIGKITDIPITIKLSETIPSGTVIAVSASLDCNPYLVNKDFTFRVGKIRESFEASTFKVFPWINISPVPWVIDPNTSIDGGISARSGAISHSSSSSLVIRTVYSADDSVRFYYKVSSEPNYDFLAFKLNGTEVFKTSGELPWNKKSVAVHAGLNTLEWVYRKDNSVSEGSDCAWLDLIDFAQNSSVSYIQKDLQVAGIVSPAKNDHYGHETVSVKVMNLGKDTINGFNLAYELNNHFPPEKQHFENKVIPYGDTVTVTFSKRADLSKYGIYDLLTYGFDNNDDFPMNDTAWVNIENTAVNEAVSVFPVPFTDRLNIIINSPSDGRIHISFTNSLGVTVYDVEREIGSGTNTITIDDFKGIASVYYLKISGDLINKTIPVVKIFR